MRKPIDLNFKGTIKFTDAQLSEMAEMYEAGTTVQDISARFGIGVDAVWGRLSAMGIKSRPVGRPPVFTPENMQAMIEMRRKNRAWSEISRDIGFHPCYLRRLFREYKARNENTLPV